MANPAGKSKDEALKLDFDRRVMLQFRGSVVTSDAGLLAYRELDDALGLSTMAGETLADARTGKNERHALVGLLRQSVFGRLAGYEDVNDAERLRHDPAMRWIVGGKAAQGRAASPSQMGRFETQWLTVYGRSCNSKRTFAPSGRGGIVYGRQSAAALRPLVDAHPAVRREPLLRQEAALVVHLVRAAHPIAEIDVGKPHPLRPDDMIEDHERAQRPRRFLRIEERIDHRQTVAEHVGQRHGKEVAAAADTRGAVGWRRCARRLAPPVFDDAGLDMAVLDHHGVVEHRHVGHAAVAMARIEIGAENRVLLRGGHRKPHLALDIGVAVGDAPHAVRGAEFPCDHAHRDAAAAPLAGRPVGDRLAAAEAALGEDIVEFGSALADEVREDLPLLLAGKVRTRRGGRQVELRRVARVLGHGANRLLPARSGHRQPE